MNPRKQAQDVAIEFQQNQRINTHQEQSEDIFVNEEESSSEEQSHNLIENEEESSSEEEPEPKPYTITLRNWINNNTCPTAPYYLSKRVKFCFHISPINHTQHACLSFLQIVKKVANINLSGHVFDGLLSPDNILLIHDGYGNLKDIQFSQTTRAPSILINLKFHLCLFYQIFCMHKLNFWPE